MVRAASRTGKAPDPTDLPTLASLPVDQVARNYYDLIPRDSWAWIRDMWILDDGGGFLLVEDDAGYIWKVPFTVDGDDVEFDDPVQVRQEYREVAEEERADRESVTVEAVNAGANVVRFSRPTGDQRPATIYAGRSPQSLPVQAQAIARHTTETSDGPWDGTEHESRLSNDDGEDIYREAYAWADPDGDADTKAGYSFLHHEISENGSVGAANLTACSTGIGVLNGGRGVDVDDQDWSDDRTSIHTHLAGHLRDADVDPPELQELSAGPTPEAAAVTASGKDAPDRHVRGESNDDTDNDDQSQERNTTMEREEIIELLGLPEDATDEDIRTALAERNAEGGDGSGGGDGTETTPEGEGTETAPAEGGDGEGGEEQTDTTTEGGGDGGDGGDGQEPTAEQRERVAAGAGNADPEVRRRVLDDLRAAGMEVVDGDRLARLESGVEKYEEERRTRAEQERDRILTDAIKAGKFAPSRRDHFVELWEADPEGTRDLVENRLSAGSIPVEERGHADDGADEADEEYRQFAHSILPELARSEN